uniref:Phosphoenolpyruvate synthase n=1 Tax=Magallana gigas TaxID=29159 RepID=K1QMB3_MAGGI
MYVTWSLCTRDAPALVKFPVPLVAILTESPGLAGLSLPVYDTARIESHAPLSIECVPDLRQLSPRPSIGKFPSSTPVCISGRWYHLKRLVFLGLLKLRQRKKRKEKSLKEGNVGYGLSVTDPEKMEESPPLLEHPHAIDSVYFGGFNKDGIYFVARVARRHGRYAEVWLYLHLPGVGDFHHPVHPDTLISNVTPGTLTAGGLKIEMKGVCKELDKKEGSLVHTKFSFTWKAVTDPFNFDTDVNPKALADGIAREGWTREFFNKLQRDHQTHYEQWGELSGRLQVYETGGLFIDMSFTSFSLSLKVGYVMFPSAQTFSVEDTDIQLWRIAPDEGPLNKYSFSFKAGELKFDVEVKGKVTTEFYHHEDRGSHIYEKCSCFVVNGRPAYGITEFHYRNMNGTSYTPPSCLPLLCEPRDLPSELDEALTLPFTEEACGSSPLVGGKGAQLGLLSSIQHKEDFVVTKGFSITLNAYRQQLQRESSIVTAITKIEESFRIGTIQDIQSRCSDAVETIAGSAITDAVRAAILSSMEEVFGADFEHSCVAVRSSASGEDGTEASGAGQMETFLGVSGIDKTGYNTYGLFLSDSRVNFDKYMTSQELTDTKGKRSFKKGLQEGSCHGTQVASGTGIFTGCTGASEVDKTGWGCGCFLCPRPNLEAAGLETRSIYM